jgi:hypothetical protein
MTISEQLKIIDDTKHEIMCLKEAVSGSIATLKLVEEKLRAMAYKLQREVLKQAVES